MNDTALRRAILAEGEMYPNGIAGEQEQQYRVGPDSLGLAVVLAQLIKARGLGSVGVAITFEDRVPLWAYTAVGWSHTASGELLAKQDGLVRPVGDGVLIGVEGASSLSSWPADRKNAPVRATYWIRPEGTLPTWRKLARFFPKAEWKTEASEVAERLFTAHREQLSSHWVSLGNA